MAARPTNYQYNIRHIYKTPNNSIKIETDPPPHTTLDTSRKRRGAFVNIHSSRAYDMTKSAEVVASPTTQRHRY